MGSGAVCGAADFVATRPGHQVILDRLANSYWLSHRLRQSKARVVYGNVYDIPEQIGSVAIAVYGSILLHLRELFPDGASPRFHGHHGELAHPGV